MLKTDPKYGYFPRWPEDGDRWLHPDDVALARRLIPSQRIFRRDGSLHDNRRHEGDGCGCNYILLHYGTIQIRAHHALWQEICPDGFDMGDWVEVKTRGYQNTPRTGVIREMLFHQHSGKIEYQIKEHNMPIETVYHAEDLRHIEPTHPNEWSSEIRTP